MTNPALMDAVLADPSPAPKLVYADWLEEHGDTKADRDLMLALRWCARRGRHPEPWGKIWLWCRTPAKFAPDHRSSIHRYVFDAMRRSKRGHASGEEAFASLAGALARLREIVE